MAFDRIVSIISMLILLITSFLGMNTDKTVPTELISYDETQTVVTVALPENPTTGYTWDLEVTDYTRAVVISDKYIGSTSSLLGSGGTRVISLKGVAEGETQVIFNYQKSWDGESERTVVINITVNADRTLEAVLISDTGA